MVKKRGSVHSLFVPGFLHPGSSDATPTSPTSEGHIPVRQRTLSNTPSVIVRSLTNAASTLSTRSRPSRDLDTPLADLLDDDPFANLSGPSSFEEPSFSPSESRASAPSRSMDVTPISPLATSPDSLQPSPRKRLRSLSSTSFAPSPPFMASASVVHAATVRNHVRPAHTRPAFSSRPSLPSLRTLSHSEFVPPVMVCKQILPFLRPKSLIVRFLSLILLGSQRDHRRTSSSRALEHDA